MPREDWVANTIENIFRPRGWYPEERISTVLDVACGLSLKSQFIEADIRVGFDIYRPYLEKIDATVPYVMVNGDARDIDKLFLPKSFDMVLLLDIIEHLDKPEALELLRKCETIAKKAVVIEAPEGFLPQNIDILGLGGDEFQTHRSSWEVDELEGMGYKVLVRDYTLSKVKRHTTEDVPDVIPLINAIKLF